MQITNNFTKKPAPKKRANGGQAETTRRMILDAATQVFAMHPYKASSIRMIAAQGKFYHGLIRYHFPSKASIFETILEEACQNLRRANKKWLSEMSTLRSPKEALSLFAERFTEFSQHHPEVFRIISLNNNHKELDSLPGHRHLENLVINFRKDFEKTFQGLMPIHQVQQFLSSLILLSLHYFSGGNFWAISIGIDPKSDEYFQWIKETILFIFLPVLKEVMSSNRNGFRD